MSHVREHTTCGTAYSILGRFFLSPHILNVHLIHLCAQEAVLPVTPLPRSDPSLSQVQFQGTWKNYALQLFELEEAIPHYSFEA